MSVCLLGNLLVEADWCARMMLLHKENVYSKRLDLTRINPVRCVRVCVCRFILLNGSGYKRKERSTELEI